MENILFGECKIPMNDENNSASYSVSSNNQILHVNYFPNGLFELHYLTNQINNQIISTPKDKK